MNVETLNPFIAASFSVFEMVLGELPAKGKLGVQQTSTTSSELNIVLGVTGGVQGTVIFGMSVQTALNIASKMTFQKLTILDALAKSAIAELCNMVSGNALQGLSENGFVCDITPPSIVKGNNVEISLTTLPALLVPIETGLGTVLITVGLVANDHSAKKVA